MLVPTSLTNTDDNLDNSPRSIECFAIASRVVHSSISEGIFLIRKSPIHT